MSIDKKTVEHTAHLARIELEPQELDKLSRQMQDILGFIDKLSLLNVDGVVPTTSVLAQGNVLREDVLKESLPISEVLSNAPAKEGNFFKVPKVIE